MFFSWQVFLKSIIAVHFRSTSSYASFKNIDLSVDNSHSGINRYMHISFQSNFSQLESRCMINEYDRTCILACYQLVCILQCYHESIRLILYDPCVPFLNANHNRI